MPALCPLWAKSGRRRAFFEMSALPPIADIRVHGSRCQLSANSRRARNSLAFAHSYAAPPLQHGRACVHGIGLPQSPITADICDAGAEVDSQELARCMFGGGGPAEQRRGRNLQPQRAGIAGSLGANPGSFAMLTADIDCSYLLHASRVPTFASAISRASLGEVNREWRKLTRQSGNEAKLSRMGELRAQRLAFITEIFELGQKSPRAG